MAASEYPDLKLFAGRANPALAKQVCDYLQISPGLSRVDQFPDGEVITKVLEDVRGRDCYVFQPTCGPVNENLMELMIWTDSLRRASAKRVTAVMPYFGYARQDRKDEGRVPITAKLVANLLERAGVSRIVAVDLHAHQVQGFFDVPVDHLSAFPVFVEWFQSLKLENTIFASPDVGNVKRASVFANRLGTSISIIDKRRTSGSEAVAVNMIGDVKGKNVLMADDMISTGGTITEAVRILKDHGAKDIYIAATHAIFAPPCIERLAKCPFAKLAVADTIPIDARVEPIRDRLVVLGVARLLGEAIRRIHLNLSVSELFRKTGESGRALSE